ncbi:hypothetical protein F4604DRAFT_1679454 [Suillus subluteus]|nr:hypothetical protein F4604DRAFT_1679454 [Suillus subluteus]
MDMGTCSSPEATCFFVPYNQPLPRYICTLEHFTFPDAEARNLAIAEIVKRTISADHSVSEFIHKNIPSPDAEAALRAINSICISSLNVSVARNTTHTVWNVHVDSPPNLSLKDYFEWTSRIRNLLFISEDYGSATVRTEERQFVCSGCKSFDHPMGLCLFPKIQGWFGPAASTADDSSKASLNSRANHSAPSSKSNASPRGRGNRGRGRGQGKKGRGQH